MTRGPPIQARLDAERAASPRARLDAERAATRADAVGTVNNFEVSP
jgi:hypothetical protein